MSARLPKGGGANKPTPYHQQEQTKTDPARHPGNGGSFRRPRPLNWTTLSVRDGFLPSMHRAARGREVFTGCCWYYDEEGYMSPHVVPNHRAGLRLKWGDETVSGSCLHAALAERQGGTGSAGGDSSDGLEGVGGCIGVVDANGDEDSGESSARVAVTRDEGVQAICDAPLAQRGPLCLRSRPSAVGPAVPPESLGTATKRTL